MSKSAILSSALFGVSFAIFDYPLSMIQTLTLNVGLGDIELLVPYIVVLVTSIGSKLLLKAR
jgi:hypothetical protein